MKCKFRFDGEQCENEAIPTNEGGQCMHCHRNHCRDHIVEAWHMCGWKWNAKTKMYDRPEYAE